MIKISFIVIGYNVSQFIKRAIESVMKQNMSEIEIIYVDDGSKDDSVAIVKELQQKDGRIRIIEQQNGGANSARKTGFINSKGEYIVFIDGDDWISSELAANVYSIHKKKNVDIVCFNHYLKYANSQRLENRVTTLNKNKNYLELILSEELPHELWNKSFKKEFLDKCNFVDLKEITVGDDLLANVLFGIENPSFDIDKNAYYFYFQNQTSVTKKMSTKILEIIIVLEEIETILKEKNLYDKYKEQMEFLWFYHCYYSKVINMKSDKSDIQRKLLKKWKEKKIKIKNNSFYKEYKKKIRKKNKLKMILLDGFNL